MFSVTGIGGEVFQGSLENLLKVHKIPRSSRAPEVRPQAGETPSAPHLSPRDTNRYQAAAAAYAKTLTPQPDRGPIYHAYQLMSHPVSTARMEMDIHAALRIGLMDTPPAGIVQPVSDWSGLSQVTSLGKNKKVIGLF